MHIAVLVIEVILTTCAHILMMSYTRLYRCVARELKRLEAISMSPIQNAFSEAIDGLTSIRVFGLQRQEADRLGNAVDENNKIYILGRMADRVSSNSTLLLRMNRANVELLLLLINFN